jgi:hypothetical protein
MKLPWGSKVPLEEYTKTNSIYSSMRLAFLRVIRFWMMITGCIVAAVVFCAIANATIIDKERPINLPVVPLLGVIGVVGTVAFGGKAIQSFSEPDAPEVDTMKKDPQ